MRFVNKIGVWMRSVALCLAIGAGQIEGAVIDQGNPFVNSPMLSYAVPPRALVIANGQEFRPTLPWLDFVNLYADALNISQPTEVNINIRESTILGAIIASAQDTVLPGEAVEIALLHFRFPSRVAVVPESVYVIDVTLLSGSLSLWGSPTDEYARGRSTYILPEAPNVPVLGDGDMFFAEGTLVPEPVSFYLVAAGTLVLMARLRRRGVTR